MKNIFQQLKSTYFSVINKINIIDIMYNFNSIQV